MKKIVLYLCAGILVLGITSCGKGGEDAGTQESGQSSEVSSVPEESGDGSSESPEEGSRADDGTAGDGSAEVPDAGAEGWSEEMEGLKQAVVDALGADNYWPDMPMDAGMLETFYGIGPDMYEDYMAETPMVSNNVDTLIIVRAKEDQADAVEEALKAYREANINDTTQYPMNLGKIQASVVERIDNYVIFVRLGGWAVDAETEEESIAQCQEANKLALDTIRNML